MTDDGEKREPGEPSEPGAGAEPARARDAAANARKNDRDGHQRAEDHAGEDDIDAADDDAAADDDDEDEDDGAEADAADEERVERPGDGFVVFPDPRIAAEVARIEAARPIDVTTFSWPRSIGFAVLFALAGGVLHAAVAAATEMQLGLVSIVIGVLAGLGAARGGRGRQAQIVGAVAAAVGYFAGQLMAVAALVGVGKFLEIPVALYGTLLVEIGKHTFSGIDALFLAIAVYEGWVIPRGPRPS